MDIATLDEGVVPANGCNAICFKNNCNNSPAVNIVTINGYDLREGEQLVLSGHEGEIDLTQYNAVFTVNTGASKNYQVIRKYYIEEGGK